MGGKVQRRRALGPSVFYSPWSYVDHELIAPGGDTGTSPASPDLSEAYYVTPGEGSVTVNGETVAIKKGDQSRWIWAKPKASRPAPRPWS